MHPGGLGGLGRLGRLAAPRWVGIPSAPRCRWVRCTQVG